MPTVIIDGKKYQTDAGRTIMEVCRENGVHIPTLTDYPYLESQGSGWMSVVEVQDVGLTPARTTFVGDGMVINTASDKVVDTRKSILEKLLKKHYGDCVPPCQEACPAHIDIQGYLQLVAKGRPHEAMELIRETNPIPSIIGRICPRPCETACRRNLVDQSLAICWIKRFAGDKSLLNGGRPLPKMEKKNGTKVAIIGSGPAGLSAAFYLRKMGYEPTIFEALPKPGGMLRFGIPEYRLPKKDLLDKEIKTITDMGVKLICNKRFGKDFTFASLKKDGFEATLVAVGAHKSFGLGLDGEDTLKGIYLGIDFLRDLGLGKKPTVGEKAVIIGGGNTAMDACRTALRLGAKKVTVVYRRSRTEMPASVWEIEEAEQEGVRFHYLAAPIALKGEGGKVSAIRCIKMVLGEPDASGRRRPVPQPGSEFDIPCDTVISAIGQGPDLSFMTEKGNALPGKKEIETNRNKISACQQTMSTNVEGVFTAGDCQRGAATAIWAVSDGRKAALSMDQYLRTGKVEKSKRKFTFKKAQELKDMDPAEFAHFEVRNKAHMFCLRPDERNTNFKEIEQGFDDHTAMEEASRCLECGCRAGDYCVLRDLADELNVKQPEPDPDFVKQWPNRSMVVERDPNKCIRCGLCDEVCRTVMHVGALGRSMDAGIPPQFFDETLCVSCGHCIEVCPVGAIVFNSSIKPDKTTTTFCPYCGVGCELHVNTRGNYILNATAGNGPANRGSACIKGRFGLEYVSSPERLTTPLIRKKGELTPATWDEALTLVASKFKKHKGKEFGLFASAKVTNEENYLMQKFARAVQKTNNVDHCARLCHASTVAGLANTLGSGAMTNSINEIFDASCIFAIGSNTTKAHPVMGSLIKGAAKKGAILMVANPKRIELCNYATLFMQHLPGTDVALVMGMLHYIFEKGLHNQKFIDERTENFEPFMESLKAFDLKTVSKITGVPADQIAQAAEIYATSETSSVVYSMGITQHSHGTENVFALANLAIATGQIGRPSTGINPLRGQNNVQGACDMGALPNVYPGYQAVINPDFKAKFEKAWGVKGLDDKIGLTVTQMLGPEGKDLKAVYIIGENPAMSEPDCMHARKELEELEFLVVQDIFLTETAKYADVVLPAGAFAEKDGTFTNTERRVQLLRQCVPPVGDAIEDWKIFGMLAKKMGVKGFDFNSVSDIMEEIASVTPSYGGITFERIAETGLHWPCPTRDHPGTPYLHAAGFPRPSGRATFMALEYRPSMELPDKDYPLYLTTGRSLYHFHTATMSRKNVATNYMHPEELVQINPADAKKLNIEDGGLVTITSRRGSVTCRCQLTNKVAPGLTFMTFHFAEACANVLTNKALDPIAKIPEFKVCAVKVVSAAQA